MVNKATKAREGFALIMVLMVLAMGAVLGMSYLTSTSVRLAGSTNLLSAARAKYLAESGLQHAFYVLSANPSLLNGSASSPFGPYYADGTSDTYTFSAAADPNAANRYSVTAEAVIGGVRQRASVSVSSTQTGIFQVSSGLVVNSGTARLPASVTVNGNFHVNGSLINQAYLKGNVTATGTITDTYRRITGTKTAGAAPVAAPALQWSDYQSYYLNGVKYQAVVKTGNNMDPDDPLANGGAVTASNPAGVVVLNPPGTSRMFKLNKNLKFTGTLVADAQISLEQSGITLTAKDGFPAIVTSWNICVKNQTDATINGVVIAANGITTNGNTNSAKTSITGGLISQANGYSTSLNGTHTLTYDSAKCRLVNVGKRLQYTVDMVSWND